MDRCLVGEPEAGGVAESTEHERRLAAWANEARDLLRGITGGFLLGVPLLYTMESWWIGQTISMPRALLFLLVAYLLNLGFGTYFGFHRQEPGSAHEFGDAVEATALALVAAGVTLVLLHQIQFDDPLDVIVGRLSVTAVPVSLGVSVANHILAPHASRTEPEEGEKESHGNGAWRAALLDLGASFAGALALSLNIAPTDEIPMLTNEVPKFHLAAIVLFSLLLSYAIVFAADFGDQRRRHSTPGPFQRPITETVLAYLTSLATCAAMLWLYGQIDSSTSWSVAFAAVVILALPATVGAAAGRLAV